MIRIAGAPQEPLMSRFRSLAFVSIACVLFIPDTAAHAGPAHLAMSSLIQYSKVIQGAQDPVYAYIYNDATVGSDPLSYKVSTTYPYPSPYSYTGTKIADGGASYITVPFSFDSSQVAPANNIPVSVTGLNTESGGFVTQSGTVTVLGHAAPALILQGQIVYLTSKTTTTFQTPTTNAFGGAPPGGGEMAASANPQLLGDPPGVPTAELDLDSITTSGSAFITTTLKPFIDLPANDDPAEALPFAINVVAPAIGDYSTTFLLHYSDEQDLPGALTPGSEMVSFNVNANVASDLTTWTITSVPEPSSWQLLGGGAVASALLWRFRRRTASCSA
jgi:hypothetical protein